MREGSIPSGSTKILGGGGGDGDVDAVTAQLSGLPYLHDNQATVAELVDAPDSHSGGSVSLH